MPPVFPQPVHSFAGRRAEITRILQHIDHDTLFFLYGVGGIGKSELAYQIVHELRAQPRWADVPAILVDVRPGMTASRILAEVLPAVGAPRPPRRGRQSEDAHVAEQLELFARLLEARPHILVVDDAHHLPPEPMAEALGYLGRRVRKSRILVTSRRQLVLPANAPPPVITTLGPLDPDAAAQMTAAIVERLEIPRPEPEGVLRATHGSPFHIHRLLMGRRETSATEASFVDLSAAARRLLAALSVSQHRPGIELLRQTWAGAALDETMRELSQRFLLDATRGELVIHDLIREELASHLDRDDVAAAHHDAAAICLAALRASERPPAVLAVDAANHLLAAERAEDAWSVIERWYSAITAGGSEHLLGEPLERLRAALPERRMAIDLLVARGLVRGSRLDDASRVLDAIEGARGDTEDTRWCLLGGEIAQGRGELARAEELYARAALRAPDADTRFAARLRLATVATFAGDGPRARQQIAGALAELASPTSRQRWRAAWALTVSWMFDERYELAAEEARRARSELAGRGLDDLANQLAMLETLARIEHGDMEQARAAARQIDEDGLRQPVAQLYRAIVSYADGEARDASATLVAAHDNLRQQGDIVNAYIAGYYGSAALAEAGELGRAQRLAEETARLAERAGWRGPAARSLSQQAMLAAEGLQAAAARRLATAALASEHIAARSAARAHCALARAATIEGDMALALEHTAHARAAVSSPDLALAHAAIDIEHAAIDLVGGDLDSAIDRAERVLERQRDRARDHEAAHARLVLAAAYVARGRRSDLVLAERALASARMLADAGHLRSIQVGSAIVTAALARRDHRERASRELLAAALRELDPERGSVYASTLVAAIDGGIAARAVPGALALLAHLGFSETVDCYLVDRRGRRAAMEKEIARERASRELFVDETRAVIAAERGTREIGGRPMLCALLSVLVQAGGDTVAPETAYKRVWGVAEYHPLQHRNALYVAINRLRACLRELLPEREIIERAGDGWRLAEDVDACVAVAVRPRAPEKTM